MTVEADGGGSSLDMQILEDIIKQSTNWQRLRPSVEPQADYDRRIRVSQRRVCRLPKLHRSVARYALVCSRDDEALKERLKALALRRRGVVLVGCYVFVGNAVEIEEVCDLAFLVALNLLALQGPDVVPADFPLLK